MCVCVCVCVCVCARASISMRSTCAQHVSQASRCVGVCVCVLPKIPYIHRVYMYGSGQPYSHNTHNRHLHSRLSVFAGHSKHTRKHTHTRISLVILSSLVHCSKHTHTQNLPTYCSVATTRVPCSVATTHTHIRTSLVVLSSLMHCSKHTHTHTLSLPTSCSVVLHN